MKKGQAEMLGLAIIVILLIISLLFYVSFRNSGQRETELVRSSIRANNILNAVLLVNVDGEQMKDKLNDCSDNCDEVRLELEEIFGEILLEKQKYRFSASKDDVELFSAIGEDCEDFVKANPARFPEDYKYEFQLCYS